MKKYLLLFTLGLTLQFAAQAQISELVIEELKGAKPWSSLDINAKPGQFQFAIVTDRTGGHRPGVFMDGVRKLNLLQPEFVLSVGDLIEGYTEDVPELNRQWNEFTGFIDSLEMPFFYVPGNHDLTNKVMEKLYLEKFGKTHYHFVYNDVLFLCLNSEDQLRGAGRGTISDEQYEYIKKTLEENADVKWTLVFMHQPLWTQANPERWPDVEKLLSTRKHTVYTGHVHHYSKYKRNNSNYFTLATTGGGSSLRGPKLGEFDHVTWVTMTEDGPIMANLQLEGIWDENVSTEKTREYALDIIRSNPIQLEPFFVEEKMFEKGATKIRISNDKDIPMQVKLREVSGKNLKGFADRSELVVPPNSVEFVAVEMESRRKARPIEELGSVRIEAELRYLGEGLPDLDVPLKFNLSPQQKLKLEKAQKKVAVDGNLSDWPQIPYFIYGKKKELIGMFNLSYDENFIYIGANIMDDEVRVDTSSAVWTNDFVGFVLNGDPLRKSALDNGSGWYRNSVYILQAPAMDGMPSTNNIGDRKIPGLQLACLSAKGGYTMEAAIPVQYLKERQGEDWKSLRFNFVIQDIDSDRLDQKRYFFKPDWRGKENSVGSGMFFR